MKKFPKVSIIILNWNGWKDTVECLESLYQIDYPNYEVIVVDNGSIDDSVAKIKQWAKKRVSIFEYTNKELKNSKLLKKKLEINSLPSDKKLFLLKNDKNYGFAEGNNIAMRQILDEGDSDYVLLLNNDTIVTKDFLSIMIDSFDIDPKIAVVGNRILDLDHKIWSSGIIYYFGFHFLNKFVYQSRFVDEVVGCSFLIKAHSLRQMGLLDPVFFAYGEETDYCFRVKKKKLRIFYNDDSVIYHKIAQSTQAKKTSGLRAYLQIRNHEILGLRYYRGFRLIFFYFYYLSYVISFSIKNYKNLKFIYNGIKDGITKNLNL